MLQLVWITWRKKTLHPIIRQSWQNNYNFRLFIAENMIIALGPTRGLWMTSIIRQDMLHNPEQIFNFHWFGLEKTFGLWAKSIYFWLKNFRILRKKFFGKVVKKLYPICSQHHFWENRTFQKKNFRYHRLLTVSDWINIALWPTNILTSGKNLGILIKILKQVCHKFIQRGRMNNLGKNWAENITFLDFDSRILAFWSKIDRILSKSFSVLGQKSFSRDVKTVSYVSRGKISVPKSFSVCLFNSVWEPELFRLWVKSFRQGCQNWTVRAQKSNLAKIIFWDEKLPFLGVWPKSLSDDERNVFGWKKHRFLCDKCSNMRQKTRIWVKTLKQSCQNYMLCVQRNNMWKKVQPKRILNSRLFTDTERKKLRSFSDNCLILPENVRSLNEKILTGSVRAAFYVCRGTFWLQFFVIY